MRMIWYNGQVLPESEAKISVYDSALMFGDMVFEMTRSFRKKHFKLREHLERLYRSMKWLRIEEPIEIDTLERVCYQLTNENENNGSFTAQDEHRLMINVSRGLLGIYQGIVGVEPGPNVMVTDFPLKWTVAGFGIFYNYGVNAVIVSQRAMPARLMEPKVKHRSRLYLQMANIEASTQKGENNWALMLDEDGFITEGPGDNFFIVKDQIVLTPCGRNVLRGISRQYVIDLCHKKRIKAVECDIEPYDVLNADEAFMTGTPFCILPVTSLNGQSIGDREVGMITQKLLDWWSDDIGLNIVNQIKQWDKEARDSIVWNNATPYKFL